MKEWKICDYKDKEINWEELPHLEINEYPWYKEGTKQKTIAKIAISKDNIYIRAKAQDRYIRARAQKLNDYVHEDSCFEFFVTPWSEQVGDYFNIEFNCTGVMLMAYHKNVEEKTCITKAQAKGIVVKSSLENISSFDEIDHWELDIMVPISLLEEMSNKKVKKDIWYGNFYRCGGNEDDQYAAWNSIDYPEPSFHQPFQFGKLVIHEA